MAFDRRSPDASEKAVGANPRSTQEGFDDPLVEDLADYGNPRFLQQLHHIRGAELATILGLIPERARVLEVGGGTGEQARLLVEQGFEVASVEVETSDYSDSRVFDVIDYDGSTLPFPNNTFDVVFSSNMLEHVTNLASIYREMDRVLLCHGFAIHIMPTHWWAVWTRICHYPFLVKRLIERCLGTSSGYWHVREPAGSTARPLSWILRTLIGTRCHGERGNWVTEIAYFRPAWWCRSFRRHGYTIIDHFPTKIFYTGYSVLGALLGIRTRRYLSRIFGSACHVYVVSPNKR